MRVLVCGSRTFSDFELIWSTLTDVYLDYAASTPYDPDDSESNFYVRHGAARGADELAGAWVEAINVPRVKQEPFPADWTLGRKAGYERNVRMLEAEGAIDLGLAFIDKALSDSKGTAMMVGLLRQADIPVHVIQAMRHKGEPA